MGFFGGLMGLTSHGRKSLPAHPFFDEVIATLGESVVSAPFFSEHLLASIAIADQHLSKQVSVIPGVFPLSAHAHRLVPTLEPLFASHEDVRFAMGRSIDTRESLPSLAKAGHQEVYALLGVRCRAGGRTADQPPTFIDHSMKFVMPSEAEARNAIAASARTRLLKTYADHLDFLRNRNKLLSVEWRIDSRNPKGRSGNGQDYGGHAEYVYAEQELRPENILRGLCAWMSDPSEYLQVSPVGARVAVKGGSGNTMTDYPMMRCIDRREWIVCMVKFFVSEGLEALASETRTHRYIYI